MAFKGTPGAIKKLAFWMTRLNPKAACGWVTTVVGLCKVCPQDVPVFVGTKVDPGILDAVVPVIPEPSPINSRAVVLLVLPLPPVFMSDRGDLLKAGTQPATARNRTAVNRNG